MNESSAGVNGNETFITDGANILLVVLPVAVLGTMCIFCCIKGAVPPTSFDEVVACGYMLHRRDVIKRDKASDGLWNCELCAFGNYKSSSVCLLCGTDKGFLLLEDSKKLPLLHSNPSCGEQSKDALDITRLRAKLGRLNMKQRSALRRKQWVKAEASPGKVVWVRNEESLDRRINIFIEKADGNLESEEREPSEGYVSEIVQSPTSDIRMSFRKVKDTSYPFPNNCSLENSVLFSEMQWLSKQNFQTKNAWFQDKIQKLEIPWSEGHLGIEVDRGSTFLRESCELLLHATAEQLRMSLRVKFMGESVVDAGGVEREWFSMMAEHLFDTSTGLFTCNSENSYMISPCPQDTEDIRALYFVAIGRFIGRALFSGHLVSPHLVLPIYKAILGSPVSFSDLQFVDAEIYRSLKWMKEHNGADDLGLDFTLIRSSTDRHSPEIIDLVPRGASIPVTDTNKDEYIERLFSWIMSRGISRQLAALVRGIHDVVPPELLAIFDHRELELLLNGVPEISVDDWEMNTIYRGIIGSLVVKWWWEFVRGSSLEERARLLQYITGSSCVPAQGFKALTMNDGRVCPFSIRVVSVDTCNYPRAHTCFNRLDLPNYASQEDLCNALVPILQSELTGFTLD